SATAAGNASGFALAYAIARLAGAALMLPNGVMNCDQISVPYYSFGTQVSIFANPGRKTVLKKATADGNGLFQLSEPTAAGYTALLRFSNITFEGYAGNSAFAFRGYDLARCFFDNCQFNKALIGLDLKGGIGNSFFKCTVDGNVVGVNCKRYVGGYDGWPNLNSFDQCQIINNTSWAVDFDDGMVLGLHASDIEGNGTPGNLNTGGCRQGANIGSKDGIVAPGIVVTGNSWFEANAGRAAFQSSSGVAKVRDAFFVANPDASCMYDTYIIAGNYDFDSNIYGTNKTFNHFEEAGAASGNTFTKNRHVGAISIDAAKTMLQNDTVITTPNLRAMAAAGIKIRDYQNKIIANCFSVGATDSWLELSGTAAAASVGVGSSLSNADLFLGPLGTGLVRITNPRLVSKAAPASATAAGVTGEVRWDASYIYLCTATNTWRRIAHATW
uniref:hypothetical protein n=1 Tax=uncultured Rhizobium sp. TaxID=155567 RepID=UPI002618F49B